MVVPIKDEPTGSQLFFMASLERLLVSVARLLVCSEYLGVPFSVNILRRTRISSSFVE